MFLTPKSKDLNSRRHCNQNQQTHTSLDSPCRSGRGLRRFRIKRQLGMSLPCPHGTVPVLHPSLTKPLQFSPHSLT